MYETIKSIIKENAQLKKELFERDVKPREVEGKAIAILGPRRAGKTSFLFYNFQKLREKGKGVVFFSFDDDRIYPPNIDTLQEVVRIAKETYDGQIYFFFDEIQEVNGWERVVKRLVEREGHKVYISGSSSKLLSKEIATQLRGRTLSYELFPFSFREVLSIKGIKRENVYTESERGKMKRVLEGILMRGSFPEVVLRSEAEDIIKDYLDVMLFRDIVERWNIRNIKSIKLFTRLCLNYFASYLSISKIQKVMRSNGIDVTRNTLLNYLEYFEDAYFIFTLKRFSHSIKEVEQSISKVYVVDNGFISISKVNTTTDKGKLMENLVFVDLRRRYVPNEEIFYYKTQEGYEVDFLIKEGTKIKELIQVSYANSYEEVQEREIRALLHAKEDLKLGEEVKLTVITWDYEDEREVEWWRKKGKIRFVPLWRWLLTGVSNNSLPYIE